MKLTVNITTTLLPYTEGMQSMIVVEKYDPLTIAELAKELKIPLLLIAIASIDGVKQPLDFLLQKDTEIYLIGPISGG